MSSGSSRSTSGSVLSQLRDAFPHSNNQPQPLLLPMNTLPFSALPLLVFFFPRELASPLPHRRPLFMYSPSWVWDNHEHPKGKQRTKEQLAHATRDIWRAFSFDLLFWRWTRACFKTAADLLKKLRSVSLF
jgi:hypothetical protein